IERRCRPRRLRFHTDSRRSHRKPAPPPNWKTSHEFVLSNPTLSLLETKCQSMSQLKQIQSQITVSDLSSDALAFSRLIAFSALSPAGNLDYSKALLFSMPNPNAFSWNVVIRAFAGRSVSEAFLLYRQMLAVSPLRPDRYTFPVLLKTCAGNPCLFRVGLQIIAHVLKMNHRGNVFVHNALIHFLITSGELNSARKVFDESPVRDLVSWNSLINGYARSGKPDEALRIYRAMEDRPDDVTMIGVVTACTQLRDLKLGSETHHHIVNHGLKLTAPLVNALLDMYMKCGAADRAERLFRRMEARNAVSWTTMVVGYARQGRLDVARRVFDEMPDKDDAVPWNALMSGYVETQSHREALSLFNEMIASGIDPDEVTMTSCLSACTHLGALDVGVWIHRYVEKRRIPVNVVLGTALVDMYAKCGNISKALRVFDEIPARNALTYTAVICGSALHGDASDALSLFRRMLRDGLQPDEVTLLGVLTACCHGGLVEEGKAAFSDMRSKYNIPPQIKHYSVMVDLLGRAGLLDEAAELLESMPAEPDSAVWGALFFACRLHGKLELGERAARKLMELDPGDSGIYVLLSNMYKEANKRDEAEEVRRLMRQRGVDKTPGCSSIEVNGNLYEFTVRDKSHPRTEQIIKCLELLLLQ
ncbi:hypothetical protein M569_02407, partial [Genlisea aurea]